MKLYCFWENVWIFWLIWQWENTASQFVQQTYFYKLDELSLKFNIFDLTY